tara:strand:- start:185 stop:580 length:396 start_codon:yes stop_codon:yes gene_type:complete
MIIKKNNPLIPFLTFLLSFTILTAGVHTYILERLEIPLFDHKLVLAYIVNILLAITIYIGLYILRKKQESNLGFIFMIGSFLKFGLFFLIFYPGYKSDGEIQTIEFITFFIPYAVCLIIETFYLSRLLNNN